MSLADKQFHIRLEEEQKDRLVKLRARAMVGKGFFATFFRKAVATQLEIEEKRYADGGDAPTAIHTS